MSNAWVKVMTVCALATFSSSAMAMNDFWLETLISSTSGGTTYLTSRDNKLNTSLLGDASSFVASDGAIRGPYLEASINALRASESARGVSDMELATGLLLLSVSE
ncbi:MULTISPECIES: DUF2388 domain-containing protein [Pseudomonas]|uniref:DUF2388 domain-containing protein n=1 Tax=Pseudomonas TaxID=286 RepID=UPI000289033A|nr:MULTISPECIES: DUF2388 domain-containing protein [Pseudomonas]NBF14877.1 DUF2388 domain-containing protein [Pseudomonas sp. Fl4BN2]NNG61451.1 DUF2388 domain-containing protein [Pseudomonas sp. GC01]